MVNAARHARPATVEVSVTAANGWIELEVSDDGAGIPGATDAVGAGHVGLAIIRGRVQDAGGSFDIATRADGGTRTRVSVPIGRCGLGGSEDGRIHRHIARSDADGATVREA